MSEDNYIGIPILSNHNSRDTLNNSLVSESNDRQSTRK